jgi:hypothetical protein
LVTELVVGGDHGLGKGNRLRNRRQSAPAIDADYPFVVDEQFIAFISASLHHARCQPVEWSTGPVLVSSSQPLLSYTTQSLLLPAEADGHRDDRPVILVNPSLEQVLLSSANGRWTVNTVSYTGGWDCAAPSKTSW